MWLANVSGARQGICVVIPSSWARMRRRAGSPQELIAHFEVHPPRGEIVLLIGPPPEKAADPGDADRLLLEALMTQKASQAAASVARATGLDRKALYARALELKAS